MKKKILIPLSMLMIFLTGCGVADVQIDDTRMEEEFQVEVAEVQIETLPSETPTQPPILQVTPTEDRSDRLIAEVGSYELEVKDVLFTSKQVWVTLCSFTALEDLLQFNLYLEWQDFVVEAQMVSLSSYLTYAEEGQFCNRLQVPYGFDPATYQQATYENLPQDEDQYELRMSDFVLNHTVDLNEEKCNTARQRLQQNNPDVDFTCAEGIIQSDIVYPASMDVGAAWNLINESFMDHFSEEIKFTIMENAFNSVVFIDQPEYELISIQAEENPDHPFDLVGVKGDEGYLQVGVCYRLPRQETLDWMFGFPVEVSNEEKTFSSSSGLLIEYQNRGLEGTFRCEWIGFENFAISNNQDFPDSLTLSIPSIQSPMPEGMGTCPEIQARLDADETGIKIECEVYVDPNGGGGGGGFVILEKPEDKTEEEVLTLIMLKYANENFQGPWNLILKKNQ